MDQKDWKSILRQKKAKDTKTVKTVTWKREDLFKAPSVPTLRWLWDRILEEESRPKRSPSAEEEISLGRDEGAQEENISEKETTRTDSAQEGSRAGEDPRRDSPSNRRKERALRKLKRTNALDLRLLLPPLELVTHQLPLAEYKISCERGSNEGVHGIDCEVRIRSADLPPRPSRSSSTSREVDEVMRRKDER